MNERMNESMNQSINQSIKSVCVCVCVCVWWWYWWCLCYIIDIIKHDVTLYDKSIHTFISLKYIKHNNSFDY